MLESNLLITSQAIPSTRADSLRILFSTPGSAYIAFARILQATTTGELVYTSERLVLSPSAPSSTFRLRLTDGHLISVAVFIPGNGVLRGDVYCQLQYQYGDLSSGQYILPLGSGYVADGVSVNYPQLENTGPESGVFPYFDISLTVPAAGAEIDYECGINEIVRIVDGQFTLTTDATVTNRLVTVRFGDANTVGPIVASRTAQTASAAVQYFLWAGPNLPADTATSFYIPVPTLDFVAAAIMQTATTNIQPADQFSAPTLGIYRRALIAI